MLSLRLKKKKGSTAKFGIPMLTVVLVGLLAIIYANWTNDINKKSQVDSVARSYLLRMEAEGFLNTTDEVELMKELEKIGVKNISLTGTTRSEVDYGTKISINISGEIPITQYNVANLFKLDKQESLVSFKIQKSSTAKH